MKTAQTQRDFGGSGVLTAQLFSLKEIFRFNVSLSEDGPQRTLRHISEWLGIVVNRPVNGFNQISWLPAACR